MDKYTDAQFSAARKLYRSGSSARVACDAAGIKSVKTLYRRLSEEDRIEHDKYSKYHRPYTDEEVDVARQFYRAGDSMKLACKKAGMKSNDVLRGRLSEEDKSEHNKHESSKFCHRYTDEQLAKARYYYRQGDSMRLATQKAGMKSYQALRNRGLTDEDKLVHDRVLRARSKERARLRPRKSRDPRFVYPTQEQTTLIRRYYRCGLDLGRGIKKVDAKISVGWMLKHITDADRLERRLSLRLPHCMSCGEDVSEWGIIEQGSDGVWSCRQCGKVYIFPSQSTPVPSRWFGRRR